MIDIYENPPNQSQEDMENRWIHLGTTQVDLFSLLIDQQEICKQNFPGKRREEKIEEKREINGI
jgi:hypothetical protein